jgi:hypothetical protein
MVMLGFGLLRSLEFIRGIGNSLNLWCIVIIETSALNLDWVAALRYISARLQSRMWWTSNEGVDCRLGSKSKPVIHPVAEGTYSERRTTDALRLSSHEALQIHKA